MLKISSKTAIFPEDSPQSCGNSFNSSKLSIQDVKIAFTLIINSLRLWKKWALFTITNTVA